MVLCSPRGGRWTVWLVLGLLAAPLAAQTDEAVLEPRVSELAVRRSGERWVVSFDVVDAFPAEVVERIQSGIETTFRHRVELVGRRPMPLFPRRSLGRTVVQTSVSYDTLTRNYVLEREIVGKGWPRGVRAPQRTERRTTASDEVMRQWMSRMTDVPIPIPRDLKQGEELDIRVNCELGRRLVWLMFPSHYEANAERSVP